MVDSDLERATLRRLLSFRARMARSGVHVAIDKPLHDLAPPRRQGEPAGPPLIPDFVVSAAQGEVGVRRVVVETMGFRDAGYRERKARLHPRMRDAAGATAVVEHDFHEPAHWPQDWRDNRLGRGLWKVFGDTSSARTGRPSSTGLRANEGQSPAPTPAPLPVGQAPAGRPSP